MDRRTAVPPLGLFLLAVISLGWGTHWPIMKIALNEIPLWQYRSIVCLAAGLILMAVAALGRQNLRVPRSQWGALVASALFNVTAWQVFTAYGIILMASGKAAVVAYTMPVWAAILGVMFLRERLSGRRVVALVFGVGGILVLLTDDLATMGSSPLGVLFVLGAAIGWGAGTIVTKGVAWQVPPAALTAWQLLIGAVPIGVIAIATESFEMHRASLAALSAASYTIVIGLVICYYAWIKVVDLMPATVAALGSLLVPVLGLLSGAAILGEPLGWREILAATLVCGSLALVLFPRRAGAASANS